MSKIHTILDAFELRNPLSQVVFGLASSLKMKHIGRFWAVIIIIIIIIILLLFLLPYRQTVDAGTNFIATEILAVKFQVFF
jgi:ABC-type Fe3+-siderophore transport system permease subunit